MRVVAGRADGSIEVVAGLAPAGRSGGELIPVRRDLLIDVHQQPLGDDVRLEVDARLLHLELVQRLRIGRLGARGIEAQVTAERHEAIEHPGPGIGAGVEMLRGHQRLREHVAVGGAQPAAGGIDVALGAFEAIGNREVGLGECVRRVRREQAEQCQADETHHRSPSTLNSKE